MIPLICLSVVCVALCCTIYATAHIVATNARQTSADFLSHLKESAVVGGQPKDFMVSRLKFEQDEIRKTNELRRRTADQRSTEKVFS